MPVPLMGMRVDMWTVSFLSTAGRRSGIFHFSLIKNIWKQNYQK